MERFFSGVYKHVLLQIGVMWELLTACVTTEWLLNYVRSQGLSSMDARVSLQVRIFSKAFTTRITVKWFFS